MEGGLLLGWWLFQVNYSDAHDDDDDGAPDDDHQSADADADDYMVRENFFSSIMIGQEYKILLK